MSGIEVAGIVLAVLGALIKGVDVYDEVVTGRDVKLLVESLQVQKLMFSNSVEHLLRSIVPADELEQLLNDPRGDKWSYNGLDQRVADQLGEGAQDITRKIHDIYKTVARLQQKLPARKNDATVIARATHVIKCFVRGPHYKASLERLKQRISEFRVLVDDALKLAPARGISPGTLQDLSLVQECASWLHDALKAGWKCACEESHPANIQLDIWSPRTTAHDRGDTVCLYFSLLFADDARKAQQDHWMTAEITTSRSTLNKVRPFLAKTLSSTHTGDPSVQHAPSITPSLAMSSPTITSSLTISTTTLVSQGSPQNTGDDLCPIIKSPGERPRTSRRRLGSISDKSGHNYDLFSRPEAAAIKSSITLTEVYRQQSALSTRNRVQLALMLAWGVLQISSTSWLKGKWTKDNILLVMDAPNKPLPYLSHRFESSRRDSLLSSTLSPITIDQVGDWVNNTSLFALGVFLLEMCFDRPIEDLATANEKNESGEASNHTPILTAMRLSKLAQDQLGVSYAQAVEGCLKFPKIEMDTDGKPKDFTKFATIVMRDIIRPLETVAETFGK